MSSITWARESRRMQENYRDSYLVHYPDVVIDGETALMSRRDLERLDEYSCSVPTGVYLGKCWKCTVVEFHPEHGWLLRWYGWPKPNDGKSARVNSRRIVVVDG